MTKLILCYGFMNHHCACYFTHLNISKLYTMLLTAMQLVLIAKVQIYMTESWEVSCITESGRKATML